MAQRGAALRGGQQLMSGCFSFHCSHCGCYNWLHLWNHTMRCYISVTEEETQRNDLQGKINDFNTPRLNNRAKAWQIGLRDWSSCSSLSDRLKFAARLCGERLSKSFPFIKMHQQNKRVALTCMQQPHTHTPQYLTSLYGCQLLGIVPPLRTTMIPWHKGSCARLSPSHPISSSDSPLPSSPLPPFGIFLVQWPPFTTITQISWAGIILSIALHRFGGGGGVCGRISFLPLWQRYLTAFYISPALPSLHSTVRQRN